MIKDLISKSQLLEDRVGSIFTVYAEKGVSVDPQAFNDALDASGFGEFKKSICKPHTALSRAVGNGKKGNADDGVASQWSRIGEDIDGILSFGLLRKKADKQGKDIDTEVVSVACVRKDGQGGMWFIDRKPLTKEEQRTKKSVESRYQKERGFLTISDLRATLNEVCQKSGIRLGSSSSFLALAGQDERILKLQNALDLGGMKMVVSEIFDTNSARFSEIAQESFIEQAEGILQQAESRLAFAKSALAGERKATMKDLKVAMRLQEETVELLEKAKNFKAALGFALDDVDQAAQKAQATLVEALAVCSQSL